MNRRRLMHQTGLRTANGKYLRWPWFPVIVCTTPKFKISELTSPQNLTDGSSTFLIYLLGCFSCRPWYRFISDHKFSKVDLDCMNFRWSCVIHTHPNMRPRGTFTRLWCTDDSFSAAHYHSANACQHPLPSRSLGLEWLLSIEYDGFFIPSFPYQIILVRKSLSI